MITVAIVTRRLREGKIYEDIRKAWYHTVRFGTVTRRYSLINAMGPRGSSSRFCRNEHGEP